MPVFHLSDETAQKLRSKFLEFQCARKKVHELIIDYVADYRQFTGSRDDRREFLEDSFAPRVPDFSHLIFDDDVILWHVSDIATLLGRNQSSISRTLSQLEHSQGWAHRLLALRRPAKSANGNNIFVYQQEIFDLIIDRYEEEYLLRFSRPRWGSHDNAPDEDEIRRFWSYLRECSEPLNRIIELPDVPAMTWGDILSLVWDKVFSLRISTVTSVVFVVCFEIARKFFGVPVWVAVVPALSALVCVVMIHSRRFRPDTLSNIGAGALLFTLLWISAALSLSDSGTKKQNIILTPVKADNRQIYYTITHNIGSVKEFMYCISPDTVFHSTGFLNQMNPDNNLPYPSLTIQSSQTEGIVDIAIKFIDDNDKQSPARHFTFDVDHERMKLNKSLLLGLNDYPWVTASQYESFASDEVITEVALSPIFFSPEIKSAIKSLLYGINTEHLILR